MANTMGNCRDCKHWDKGAPMGGWGLCALGHSAFGVARYSEPQYSDSLAYAQGGGDHWGAWLNTKPDFGCVQWAAKKVKEGEDV